MDGEIAALARRQRGYVTRQQLLALGETRAAIQHGLQLARLIPVYAGVYAVGHLPTLPHDRAFAATLACGRAPSSATTPRRAFGESTSAGQRRFT